MRNRTRCGTACHEWKTRRDFSKIKCSLAIFWRADVAIFLNRFWCVHNSNPHLPSCIQPHKRLVVAGCHCTACNTTARREYEEELVPSIFGGMRGHIHARHTGASSQPQRCRSPHKHHSAHRLLLLAPSSSSSAPLAFSPETFAAAALLFFFAPSLPRANCPMWQNILQSWH